MKRTILLSLQNFFSLFGMFELWRMVLLTRAFASFLLALSRKRIDLKSMLGVYVVMGTGLLVAFLTLIGEIFWNRREKLKTLNKTKRLGVRPESSSCYFMLVFLFFCFFCWTSHWVSHLPRLSNLFPFV